MVKRRGRGIIGTCTSAYLVIKRMTAVTFHVQQAALAQINSLMSSRAQNTGPAHGGSLSAVACGIPRRTRGEQGARAHAGAAAAAGPGAGGLGLGCRVRHQVQLVHDGEGGAGAAHTVLHRPPLSTCGRRPAAVWARVERLPGELCWRS